MLVPGLILLGIGIVLMYAFSGILSVIGLICVVIGAILAIIVAVQMAAGRAP